MLWVGEGGGKGGLEGKILGLAQRLGAKWGNGTLGREGEEIGTWVEGRKVCGGIVDQGWEGDVRRGRSQGKIRREMRGERRREAEAFPTGGVGAAKELGHCVFS